MRRRALSQRIVSWVAALALVMGSLAPALSWAFAPRTGEPWLAVCSASGLTVRDAGGDLQAPAAPAHDLQQHCPSCALHTTDLAPPPAPARPLSLLPVSFERPALFLAAPRTLEAWRAAEARGPPTSS